MEDKLLFSLMVATMAALEVGERPLRPAPIVRADCDLARLLVTSDPQP